MKKLILILFFIFQFSFSQSTKFEIDSILISQLEKLNVDFKGYTRISCTTFSSTESTAYLFWEDKSEIKMQKIDFVEYPNKKLNLYKPIIIKDDFFFKEFNKAQKELASENEVKRHRTHLTLINEDNNSVSTGFSMISHSCYRFIKIKYGDNEFNKGFDYYNLKKYGNYSNAKPNINFAFNNNLKIVKWDKLINSQISSLEKTTEFELINPK